MPDIAIVDADLMMNAPKGLTAAAGIDAATHALEAYASMLATDFTDGLALKSLKMIFEFLPGRMRTDNGTPSPGKKWGMPPPWRGWRLPTRFWGCVPLHGP
jgi:acetaldehyde dehydrogenase/alcohol dehydrogenase